MTDWRMKAGESVIRNLKSGKEGIYMQRKERPDGEILIRVRFGRYPAWVNAANCALVPAKGKRGRQAKEAYLAHTPQKQAKTGERLVKVNSNFRSDESLCARNPDCPNYDGCLSVVAKYNNLRMVCGRCDGRTPIDETLCEAITLGLIHVRRLLEL